jgi:hypothetical protein
MRSFLISIQKEEKFFVARCPELGVTSQGESLEDAQANIKEETCVSAEKSRFYRGTSKRESCFNTENYSW